MNGNISVMENRLETVETMVSELHAVVKGQSIVNTNLERTLALLQQSHFALADRYEKNTEPKVNELWDNRSQAKGGFSTARVLGAVFCGLVGALGGGATVAGFLYSILRHNQ